MPRSLAACEVAGFAHVPLFICGCSLGGCIVVNAIHQQPELFRGTILLAPMLSLEKASRHGLNPYLRCGPRLDCNTVKRLLARCSCCSLPQGNMRLEVYAW